MRSLDLLGGSEDVGAKAVIQRRNDDVVELAWIVPIRTDCSRQNSVRHVSFATNNWRPLVVDPNEVRIVRGIGRRRLGCSVIRYPGAGAVAMSLIAGFTDRARRGFAVTQRLRRTVTRRTSSRDII
jgi:hypothetical protein